MSDDLESSTNGGKKGKDRPEHRDLSTPVVEDQALFDFLEGLFYADPEPEQFPERVALCITSGAHSNRIEGTLWQQQFAPIKSTSETRKAGAGQGKPSKERLVALSNMLLHKMQHDCDVAEKRRKYAVKAWSAFRGSEPYCSHAMKAEPKGRFPRGYDQPPNGENGTDEDDDGILSQDRRFILKLFKETQNMFQMNNEMMVAMVDRFNRNEERLVLENANKDKLLSQKNEQLERALSLELDREERREWVRAKHRLTDKGIQAVENYGPMLMASLFGKPKLIDGTIDDTAEVLQAFLKSATEPQLETTLGEWNDTGCIKAGILTSEQALILVQVSKGQLTPDHLDKLIPPQGACALNNQQYLSLTQVFSQEQLKPLQTLFVKRNQQRQQQQGVS